MKAKILGLLAVALAGVSSPADAITYQWSIDKSADQSELTLPQGQSFLVIWTVSLLFTQTGLDDLNTFIDECIDVTDTQTGALGTICSSGAPASYTYSSFVGPYAADGIYSVMNTAMFTTNDTGTTGSDSWTIRVRVGEGVPVPEPGSLALLGLGLASLGLSRRRKAG